MAYSARRGFTNGEISGAQRQAELQQKIAEMQAQMTAAQEAVEATEFTASAGGGAVEARVNGKKEVLAITIKPEAVDPDDVEMLQDMIVAAVNEAMRSADADAADTVTEANLDAMVEFTRRFAEKTGAVIAITGAIDLVSDAKTTYIIRNGRAEMSKITGTGCQLSGVATAYAVANPQSKTVAVAAAVCLMGLAGEIGFAHLQPGEGNSSYRNRIIDAIYNMDAAALEKGARYEVR